MACRLVLIGIVLLAAGCADPEPPPVDARPVHLVPTMREPAIDGNLSEPAWETALRLTGTFLIPGANGSTPELPFVARVGADESTLYIGVDVQTGGPNPFSGPDGSSAADMLEVLFASPSEPLAASSDLVALGHYWDYGFVFRDGYWDPSRSDWRTTYPPDAEIPETDRAGKAAHDGDHAVIASYEYSIPRSAPTKYNGLDARDGREFLVLLKFTRGTPVDAEGSPYKGSSYDDYGDTWPGDSQSVVDDDTSTWLRMRVAVSSGTQE